MTRKRQKLPADPVTAYIERLSHDGRGIAKINGKITFIEGALATETVTFNYTRQKRDFDEGRLLSVITPSSHRVTPKCPHVEICGGCSLQHLDSVTQLQEKQALLQNVLERIGHCAPDELLEPIQGDPWHYRNKARLSVRYVDKKSATLIGFREKHHPRYIADIHTCSILNERVAAEIPNLKQLLTRFDDPRSIAQIEVAAGDEDVALILRHLSPLSEADLEKLKIYGDKTQFRLFLQPAGVDSVHPFHPADSDYLTYNITAQVGSTSHELTYQFHPTDFTQVNAAINQQMINRALALLELSEEDIVLDLFCGLGNFSLPLATTAASVIAVEGSEAMVRRGAMNAAQNQLSNITFLCANLDDETALQQPIFQRANKWLLDPPRAGALAIVKQLGLLKPERIVYVSCNPSTLARDADILVNQQGYHLVSAGVMDMFPHTSHVESIALFIRES